MKIGIDYRPVVAAPYSGIARQVLAMESVFSHLDTVELLRFSPCSATNGLRNKLQTPLQPSDDGGLHRPIERFRFEFKFLPTAIKKQGLDIYIATANQGLPVWRKPKNIKSILLLHDIFQLTFKGDSHKSLLKKMVYRFIDYFSIRLSVKQADYIWTPSEYTKKEVIKHFPKVESKIRVLPNHVPTMTSPIKVRESYEFPEHYWLLVGIREPRKNTPWFIESWKKARSQNSSIPDLVLVGERLDVPEHLRNEVGLYFKTAIDDETLHALYSYADLFWMPSYAEGFGLPVIEALSTGTAVATAFGSSLDEITPEGALRFDPFNADELGELMLLACKNTVDDKEKLKLWAQQFSSHEYEKRLIELLAEVNT